MGGMLAAAVKRGHSRHLHRSSRAGHVAGAMTVLPPYRRRSACSRAAFQPLSTCRSARLRRSWRSRSGPVPWRRIEQRTRHDGVWITVLRHWPRIRVACRLPAGAIIAWSTWVPSHGCRRAAPAPGHAAAMAVPPPASGVVNGACSARCLRRACGRPWRNAGVAHHACGFDGARRYCGGCALQRAGSVADLSHSRRRAHRVPTNADGRVSRCRRRGLRIR